MRRIRRRGPIMLVAVSLLIACSQQADDKGSTTAPAARDAAVQLSGRDAYERVCSNCHEEGLNGAPRTGNQDDWAGRSWLWEAVLFEHAKDGYMGMPAKGGDDTLDDATVERAAEYMLTRTFPDVTRAD